MLGTQVRLGGMRIDLRQGDRQMLYAAAEILEAITRANMRDMRDDPRLRDEAIRRALSLPCTDRCYVTPGPGGVGTVDNCDSSSGFQYASDDEKEALEGCPARDTWSDLRALLSGHHDSGRGPDHPVVADCDCLTPATLAVAAYLAWLAPSNFGVGGITLGGVQHGGYSLGGLRDEGARFAVGITLPPPTPGAGQMAHAYGLTNRRPAAPQPEIRSGEWYVWDAAAHFGMQRPKDSFYFPPKPGVIVAYELRKTDLDGLNLGP
jgi:hypothetical protein